MMQGWCSRVAFYLDTVMFISIYETYRNNQVDVLAAKLQRYCDASLRLHALQACEGKLGLTCFQCL